MKAPSKYEDLKDTVVIKEKEVLESKKQYESAKAELQNANLRKRKESTRDKLVEELRTRLKEVVDIHETLHQRNMDSLDDIRDREESEQRKKFNANQANIKEQELESIKKLITAERDRSISELKRNYHLELARLEVEHKSEIDKILKDFEQKLESGLLDAKYSLEDKLQGIAEAFDEGLNTAKYHRQEQENEKHLNALHEAEMKVEEMIGELQGDSLSDDL